MNASGGEAAVTAARAQLPLYNGLGYNGLGLGYAGYGAGYPFARAGYYGGLNTPYGFGGYGGYGFPYYG